MPIKGFWDAEKVRLLVEYAMVEIDGWLPSAADLGRKLDTTRNTIIGKLKRLKLRRDPNKIRGSYTARTLETLPPEFKRTPKKPARVKAAPKSDSMQFEHARPPKLKVYKEPAPRVIDLPNPVVNGRSPTACSMLELNPHTCRYPIGHVEEEGFHFCGAHTDDTYCEYHHLLTHQKVGTYNFRPAVKKSGLRMKGL